MLDKKGFVYILRSLKSDRYYIGSTTNVMLRFKQHQSGNVKSTRNLRPLELAFYQSCKSINIAGLIEKKLKKFKRKDFIDKIIQDHEIKLINKIDKSMRV